MRRFAVGSVSAAATLALMGAVGTSAQGAVYLDFEGYDTSLPLLGQDGWIHVSSGANAKVVATTSSGAYVGGIAIGDDDAGGGSFHARPGLPPEAAIAGALRVDVFGGDVGYDDDGLNDSVVSFDIWQDDGDGVYAGSERTIGFGIENEGVFAILVGGSAGAGSGTATGVPWAIDTWYRLTLTWSDVFDNEGTPSRIASLFAEDLTNGGLVNGGGAVATATVANTYFDFASWSGIETRATRGLIDNIEIVPVPEPTTAMLGGLGALALGLCRRRHG